MKRISASMLVLLAHAITFSAKAADHSQVYVNGQLTPKPCEMNVTHDSLEFGDISYDEAMDKYNEAPTSSPREGWIRRGFEVASSQLFGIDISCVTNSTVRVYVTETVPRTTVTHTSNNIYHKDTLKVSMRDNEKPSIGVGVVTFGGSQSVTATIESRKVTFQTSRLVYSDLEGRHIGPLDVGPDTPISLTYRGLLVLNPLVIDATKVTNIEGSIDIELRF